MSCEIRFEINDKSYDELLVLVKTSGLSEYDFSVRLFETAITEARPTTVASDLACPCGGEETYTGAFGLLLCKNCHKPSA